MRLTPILAATLATCLLIPTVSASDTLLGYWDLNQHQSRSAGTTGHLTTAMLHFGVGGDMGYGAQGSTVNLLSSDYVAGSSWRFTEFVGVAVIGTMRFDQLDLTGYKTPEISFAFRKSDLVTFFSTFSLEYDIGDGWRTATHFAEHASSEYERYHYTFDPGLLDDRNDVRIRVIFEEIMTVASSVEFDNFQIRAQAIPEPGSASLLALTAAAGLYRLNRRRKPLKAQGD